MEKRALYPHPITRRGLSGESIVGKKIFGSIRVPFDPLFPYLISYFVCLLVNNLFIHSLIFFFFLYRVLYWMCQVIMKKRLRLVDNTIILSYKTVLCFLLISLYVFGTVQSYEENSLSMYLKVFFLPHVAVMEGNHCNSPER